MEDRWRGDEGRFGAEPDTPRNSSFINHQLFFFPVKIEVLRGTGDNEYLSDASWRSSVWQEITD